MAASGASGGHAMTSASRTVSLAWLMIRSISLESANRSSGSSGVMNALRSVR